MTRSTMSVSEAARWLGVSQVRVRQLLAAGALTGRKVGRVWQVDAGPVRRRRPAPRALSERTAWAVMTALAGEEPTGLSATERRRVLARVRSLRAQPPGPDELERLLARHATSAVYVLRPGARRRRREADRDVPVLARGPGEFAQQVRETDRLVGRAEELLHDPRLLITDARLPQVPSSGRTEPLSWLRVRRTEWYLVAYAGLTDLAAVVRRHSLRPLGSVVPHADVAPGLEVRVTVRVVSRPLTPQARHVLQKVGLAAPDEPRSEP